MVTLLVISFAVLGIAPAFAEPVRIDLFGEVASTTLPPGTTDPGDPVTISIFVDSQASDENAAAGPYLATAPGTFVFVVKENPPGGGDVLSISADASSGDWEGNLFTTDPGASHPVEISLTGLGMTPDQILPDFASFTSGTAFFDGTFTPFAFTVDVDLFDVDIVPLSSPPVPALPIGARLFLSLLLIGAGLRLRWR
jgi:hypothetical protein